MLERFVIHFQDFSLQPQETKMFHNFSIQGDILSLAQNQVPFHRLGLLG